MKRRTAERIVYINRVLWRITNRFKRINYWIGDYIAVILVFVIGGGVCGLAGHFGDPPNALHDIPWHMATLAGALGGLTCFFGLALVIASYCWTIDTYRRLRLRARQARGIAEAIVIHGAPAEDDPVPQRGQLSIETDKKQGQLSLAKRSS